MDEQEDLPASSEHEDIQPFVRNALLETGLISDVATLIYGFLLPPLDRIVQELERICKVHADYPFCQHVVGSPFYNRWARSKYKAGTMDADTRKLWFQFLKEPLLPYRKIRVRNNHWEGISLFQDMEVTLEEDFKLSDPDRMLQNLQRMRKDNHRFELPRPSIERCMAYAHSLGVQAEKEPERWNDLFYEIDPDCEPNEVNDSEEVDDSDELDKQQQVAIKKKKEEVDQNIRNYMKREILQHCPNVLRRGIQWEATFYSPCKHSQYTTLTDLVHMFDQHSPLRIGSSMFTVPKLTRMYLDKAWAVVFYVG